MVWWCVFWVFWVVLFWSIFLMWDWWVWDCCFVWRVCLVLVLFCCFRRCIGFCCVDWWGVCLFLGDMVVFSWVGVVCYIVLIEFVDVFVWIVDCLLLVNWCWVCCRCCCWRWVLFVCYFWLWIWVINWYSVWYWVLLMDWRCVWVYWFGLVIVCEVF